MTDITKIKAPFTSEQVLSLNDFQTAGLMHPFTCGEGGCRSILVAVEWGWVCPKLGCEYTQDWAHSFMADGSWKSATGLSPFTLLAATAKLPYHRRMAIRELFRLRHGFESPDLPPAQWVRELSNLCRAAFTSRNKYAKLAAGQLDGDPRETRKKLQQEMAGVSALSLWFVEHLISRQCRICGCTDDHACPGGCGWAESGLCDNPECLAKDKEITP